MKINSTFEDWFVSNYGDGPAAQAVKPVARIAWESALHNVVDESIARPEEAQLVEALDNLQACAGTIYGQYGDRFKNSLAMDLHHAIEKAQALVRERVPQTRDPA